MVGGAEKYDGEGGLEGEMGGGAGRISISHDYYFSHSNTEHSYAQKRFQKSADAAQMVAFCYEMHVSTCVCMF